MYKSEVTHVIYRGCDIGFMPAVVMHNGVMRLRCALIDYTLDEFDDIPDFSDLQHVGLMFTTTEDGETQFQWEANVEDFKLDLYINGEPVPWAGMVYQDANDMAEAIEKRWDFDEFYTVALEVHRRLEEVTK